MASKKTPSSDEDIVQAAPSASPPPVDEKEDEEGAQLRLFHSLCSTDKNVLRFNVSAGCYRVAAYFVRFDEDAEGKEEHSVLAFVGDDLASAQATENEEKVTIDSEDLQKGVWLVWEVRGDGSPFNLLLRSAGPSHSWHFSALLLDAASSVGDSSQQEKVSFLCSERMVGGDWRGRFGKCGGILVGPHEVDYILPADPSTPSGSPRLLAYNLSGYRPTAGVRRRSWGASGGRRLSQDRRGLQLLPIWEAMDPAAVGLDLLEHARVEQLFNEYDTDKSGSLDPAEVSRIASEVYEILQSRPLDDQAVEELFEKYDTNKDGQLSETEFKTIFVEIKQQMIDRGDLPCGSDSFEWMESREIGLLPALSEDGPIINLDMVPDPPSLPQPEVASQHFAAAQSFFGGPPPAISGPTSQSFTFGGNTNNMTHPYPQQQYNVVQPQPQAMFQQHCPTGVPFSSFSLPARIASNALQQASSSSSSSSSDSDSDSDSDQEVNVVHHQPHPHHNHLVQQQQQPPPMHSHGLHHGRHPRHRPPPPATANWQVLYPELVALSQLAELRKDLPDEAYWQLQSGFVDRLNQRFHS